MQRPFWLNQVLHASGSPASRPPVAPCCCSSSCGSRTHRWEETGLFPGQSAGGRQVSLIYDAERRRGAEPSGGVELISDTSLWGRSTAYKLLLLRRKGVAPSKVAEAEAAGRAKSTKRGA
eukprot:356135-Chlamydomonas_euryale.AAC.8